jgi:hypothetical protein
MKISRVVIVLSIVVFSSCAEMMQMAQQSIPTNAPLTQTEIIAGLKEALVTGTKKSVAELGTANGYFRDEAVKILLPPEADIVVDNVSRIPGGDKLIDDVLLHINRAAEDAAKDAAPIFVNSITSMTITDAVDILRGEENAATAYLHKTTYDQLFELYRPKIKKSVEKKLAGNISTKESWDTLLGKWNRIAGSFAGQMAGFKTIDTELEDYLTHRALHGLFVKIEQQEKEIRSNPGARVTTLLKRVFGSVD